MDQIAEVIPLKVTVPQTSQGPNIMEIIDPYASVRAIFIERDSIESIPDLWRNSCGFYILFSPLNADGSYSVYVGKSDRDFRRRLRSHNESKDYWTSALLVQRDSVEKLTSTHASFLEGAMRDIFYAAPHVTCHNIAPTGDHTIDSNEHMVMRQVVNSALRMMAVRGYRKSLLPPATVPTPPVAEPVRSIPAPAPMAPPQLSSRQATPLAPAHREVPQLSMSVPSGKRAALPTPPPSFAPAAAEKPAPAPTQVVTAEPEPASTPEPSSKAEVSAEPAAVEKKTSWLDFSWLFSEDKPKKKSYDKAAVLADLMKWRDETAKAEQKPKHYVIENYTLEFLADRFPKDQNALLSIPGIKTKKRDKYGDAIMKILSQYEK